MICHLNHLLSTLPVQCSTNREYKIKQTNLVRNKIMQCTCSLLKCIILQYVNWKQSEMGIEVVMKH